MPKVTSLESYIHAWILLFNLPFRRKKNADEYDSELLSSNHRVTADTQRQKRQGCEENLSVVVLVIFFDWCFYYSICTSPDTKNTFTLLSVNNILQLTSKQFSKLQWDSNQVLCIRAAVLCQQSCKDSCTRSVPNCWVHFNPWKKWKVKWRSSFKFIFLCEFYIIFSSK